MIFSMTGFGRGSASTGAKVINIEIKSLNSKQLDINVKLPTRYRRLEGELRNMLVAGAERGKVEAIATIELTGSEIASPFNVDLIKQYKEEIERLDAEIGIESPSDWHSVLFRMPDVMKGEDSGINEGEEEAFFAAAKEAIENMNLFRRDEGLKLYNFFEEKLANIRKLLEEVEPFEEGRVAKIRARLYDQLEKLTGVEIDNARLEQELIYYIEKLDISEEKQRLKSHLDYFLETMGKPDCDENPGNPKGKKLGFISQEMGREINTLGSKSNNAEMQIIVVKMKDELEQIKEQVLNVL